MDEERLRDALKNRLRDAEFPEERQQAVLQAVRKDEKAVKRRASAALVFAIVMMLVFGGAAIAPGLGVFGQSGNDKRNEQSAVRLERLEDASMTVNDTQAAQAPSAPDASVQPKTVRDTMLKGLYERRFNLTLNQSYCDGNKLYYSYTLTTNTPLAWYSGEGTPSGFVSWDMQEEGKYVDHYTNAVEENQRRIVTFFAGHPVGYIGRESMCVGDGAAMNGKPLTILDSGETVIDDYTIQGFQEVELPEDVTPDGEIEIELSILYGVSLYAQDKNNVYWAHVATPENRGIFRLPFVVTLNGQTETVTGMVATSAYSAAATVMISDVDVSGEVVFDAPSWAAAFEADADGKHPITMPTINSYTLVAGGVEYPNLDGAYGVNADGQFFVRIRYDLPESRSSMILRPTSSGIEHTGETQQNEPEEIVLMK